MIMPVLILVSGPPAAGKTTLSRRLAAEFHLPLVAKDAIKETLFDTLGFHDAAWAQSLGRASIALLWQCVETHLSAGHTVIAESNFHAVSDSERIAVLRDRCDCVLWQLHCTAAQSVLWERFLRRDGSEERHPGHRQDEAQRQEKFQAALASGVWEPLHIPGETRILDTNDWAALDWEPVSAAVRGILMHADQSAS